MKKGSIVLSLQCRACGQLRPQPELGCVSYSPVHLVTTFFRYCKDKPQCKEKAELYARDKLLP